MRSWHDYRWIRRSLLGMGVALFAVGCGPLDPEDEAWEDDPELGTLSLAATKRGAYTSPRKSVYIYYKSPNPKKVTVTPRSVPAGAKIADIYAKVSISPRPMGLYAWLCTTTGTRKCISLAGANSGVAMTGLRGLPATQKLEMRFGVNGSGMLQPSVHVLIDQVTVNWTQTTTTPKPATGKPKRVIVDNGTKGKTRAKWKSHWKTSRAPKPYKGKSLYTKKNGNTYIWETKLVNGKYCVQLWWTATSKRDTKAKVRIYDGTKSQSKKPVYQGTVNQRKKGGRWNTVRKITFKKGYSRVVVERGGNNAKVNGTATCADAVRFEPCK